MLFFKKTYNIVDPPSTLLVMLVSFGCHNLVTIVISKTVIIVGQARCIVI